MKLGVYRAQAHEGPLVLVPLCMQPGIDLVHRHGRLAFLGILDPKDQPGIEWQAALDPMGGDMHALIACPLQIAALLPCVDARARVDRVLLAGREASTGSGCSPA